MYKILICTRSSLHKIASVLLSSPEHISRLLVSISVFPVKKAVFSLLSPPLLFCFGFTPNSTQSLFLALHAGITPDRLRGSQVSGIKLRSATCKASAWSAVQLIRSPGSLLNTSSSLLSHLSKQGSFRKNYLASHTQTQKVSQCVFNGVKRIRIGLNSTFNFPINICLGTLNLWSIKHHSNPLQHKIPLYDSISAFSSLPYLFIWVFGGGSGHI